MAVRATLLQPAAARAVLALLVVLLASLLVPEAGQAARGNVKLTASLDRGEPAKLEIGTRASRKSRRVVFFVDGRRRAVDRSPGWRLSGRETLRAANVGVGRHRVSTRVYFKDGRMKSDSRSAILEPTLNPRTGSRWRLVPSRRGRPSAPSGSTSLVANFEQGLSGWNTAGVGDTVPTVVSDTVREGSGAANVTLTGSQGRSELILGGDGSSSLDGYKTFNEGDEAYYSFSFLIKSMQYGRPGAHNLIYQLHSDGTGSPPLGLALWDYEGDDGVSGGRGLWSHGSAMGGDRFLAPLDEDRWYDVAIRITNSRTGNGSYDLYLDGELIDSRSGVNTIRTDRTYNYMKNGLYRNGDEIPGTSELRIDNARLGTSLNAVAAG
jgi:hypothetical protein